MQERRRYQRFAVSWTVRVWFGDDAYAIAKTADASLHGACVVVSPYVTPFLELGHPYRIDFHPGTPDEFTCTGDIRNIINKGYELQLRMSIEQELPVNALAPAAAVSNSA
jgi:hypothetical protein